MIVLVKIHGTNTPRPYVAFIAVTIIWYVTRPSQPAATTNKVAASTAYVRDAVHTCQSLTLTALAMDTIGI